MGTKEATDEFWESLQKSESDFILKKEKLQNLKLLMHQHSQHFDEEDREMVEEEIKKVDNALFENHQKQTQYNEKINNFRETLDTRMRIFTSCEKDGLFDNFPTLSQAFIKKQAQLEGCLTQMKQQICSTKTSSQ